MDETLLPLADRSGCISGAKEDKSELFKFTMGESGVPMIDDAPVVMECEVDDIYETKGFESFVCKITNTFAEEKVLTADGKIDYRALKPIPMVGIVLAPFVGVTKRRYRFSFCRVTDGAGVGSDTRRILGRRSCDLAVVQL